MSGNTPSPAAAKPFTGGGRKRRLREQTAGKAADNFFFAAADDHGGYWFGGKLGKSAAEFAGEPRFGFADSVALIQCI